MDALLTCYFTSQHDPQRGSPWPTDSDACLEQWAPGVIRLGLNGVVFHDQLSEAFTQRHTQKGLRFEKVDSPQGRSCNDHRFFVYRKWLEAHPDVERVFCTDLFDVRVLHNPFELIQQGRRLWAGREDYLIGERDYFCVQWNRVFAEDVPVGLRDKPLLNAGIFGGRREDVFLLLNGMITMLSGLEAFNANMPCYNRVLYETFDESEIWARGAPLHSRFFYYEQRDDVCFIHK